MSVQTELDRIIGLVVDSHEVVKAKGGTTATPYLLANLPDAIESIPTGSTEDLNAVLTEQEELIDELKEALENKASGYNQGYADGEESRNNIEDGLLAKTLTEYRNTRPVTIGNRFFSYFYNLTSVDLPNAVSVDQYAFVFCTSLQKIVLPSVTTIGPFAFQDSSLLTVIDLYKVNALQSNVFTRTNLTTLILRKSDGITANNSTAVFNSTPISRGEGFIYVPKTLVDTYKAEKNWSTYADQIRAIEDYPEICEVSV